MKRFISTLLMLAVIAGMFNARAARLWVIGEATSYGWSCDDATALLSAPGDDNLFTGTLYLTAGKTFKFMTVPDFGNEEYGAVPGATWQDGTIAIAKGTDDNGYSQLEVAEDANYLITVNLTDMTATVVKSAYQDTRVNLASIFLVGSATAGGWSVDEATPLYQDAAAPYQYSATDLALTDGSFKIATVIKGGGTFAQKYFYFRDSTDPDKIVLDQDGDLQWTIGADGRYDISVNLLASTISIKEAGDNTGIDSVTADSADAPAEYYTLTGVRVINPSGGIFVKRCGAVVSKVCIK